jgi:hypothetical protein
MWMWQGRFTAAAAAMVVVLASVGLPGFWNGDEDPGWNGRKTCYAIFVLIRFREIRICVLRKAHCGSTFGHRFPATASWLRRRRLSIQAADEEAAKVAEYLHR